MAAHIFCQCTYISVDVEVEFKYEAEQPDELSINVGDVIKNVVMSDGGWWEGELNGKKGMFPDNFVKVKQLYIDLLKKEMFNILKFDFDSNISKDYLQFEEKASIYPKVWQNLGLNLT